MKTPLKNDFDMFITKDQARASLVAHGWQPDDNNLWFKPLESHNPVLTKQTFGLTLRQAWEHHKLEVLTKHFAKDFDMKTEVFGNAVKSYGL